jgi:hypothetical protein
MFGGGPMKLSPNFWVENNLFGDEHLVEHNHEDM